MLYYANCATILSWLQAHIFDLYVMLLLSVEVSFLPIARFLSYLLILISL